MKKITKARTCVYNVNYHIVWTVKYRHKILNSLIENRIKEIFNEISIDKGFIIHEIEVGECDHIHVFVSAHPKVAPSYIVKMLKGISARKILMEFPELSKKLWDGNLWSHSFYLETVGSVSEEAIKEYIKKQKKGDE